MICQTLRISRAVHHENVTLGYLEMLSTAFAVGWARYINGAPASVYACRGTEILGFSTSDMIRADLQEETERKKFQAGGFFILFNRVLTPDELAHIEIRAINLDAPLERLPALRGERYPLRQIFILGSPRSGTSELGKTLAQELKLPWLGEFHGAALFAAPAAGLRGNAASPNGLQRFLATQKTGAALAQLAQRTYYSMHGSASFIDKTPGIPMIRAAPFLAGCFPGAKFIYLQRNGISNLLSRMTKFGGDFNHHCADWAAALNNWAAIRGHLPDYLEIRQEEMLEYPEKIGNAIAAYLAVPELTEAISASLRNGTMERTGAGIGRTRLADAGWSAEQTAVFLRTCGPTMQKFGYPF